jgi:hypothetical protein
MAKIKVTSANVDAKAAAWLAAPNTDTLVFYDENFKYNGDEIIRIAFNLGHIVKIVSLEGKLKEVEYLSATI